MTDTAAADLSRALREQAAACDLMGSPLYARLLEATAADLEADGPSWEVLRGKLLDTPLRFMAAMHRLVLTGRAPELAGHYPSAGGGATGDPWLVFRQTLVEHRDEIRKLLDLPCQTNEVGRSAALLGGFLLVARETGLPLALAEIGASAGLNLRWDRYRYESAGAAWGDPDSPVVFPDAFTDSHPPFDVRVKVRERRGCDLAPLDPGSAEDRLVLRSSVWADQVERLRRLEAALGVAARVRAVVERTEATEWLARRLTDTRPGNATVVFHSIVEVYLSPERRARIRELMEDAGTRATRTSPLAWLRFEHAWDGDLGLECEVTLTLWPGGEKRNLGRALPHGPPVRWLAQP
ncbi:MAG: DUF2332 domain-containing protein [Actinomycetota bacterium]|nr:DUF2332 domain-containing protein [Actinomycetota bacterium]